MADPGEVVPDSVLRKQRKQRLGPDRQENPDPTLKKLIRSGPVPQSCLQHFILDF